MASGTSHVYSFISVNVLPGVDFRYDNLGLGLGKPSPGQNYMNNLMLSVHQTTVARAPLEPWKYVREGDSSS